MAYQHGESSRHLKPQPRDAWLSYRFINLIYLYIVFVLSLQPTTYKMASTTQNPMFAAWESNPCASGLVQVQFVVDYCASRFRMAAMKIATNRLSEEQGLIHVLYLQKELV